MYHVSKAWVEALVPDSESGGEVKLLSALTEPFVNLIVQLDETVLDCWSDVNCTDAKDSLIMQKCRTSSAKLDVTQRILDVKGNLVHSSRDVSIHSTSRNCKFEK